MARDFAAQHGLDLGVTLPAAQFEAFTEDTAIAADGFVQRLLNDQQGIAFTQNV